MNIPEMSLITNDDQLCQLLANISSMHPIDYKILTNQEEITYKEVVDHLLRQERPSMNASAINADTIKAVGTTNKTCMMHPGGGHSTEECRTIK